MKAALHHLSNPPNILIREHKFFEEDYFMPRRHFTQRLGTRYYNNTKIPPKIFKQAV